MSHGIVMYCSYIPQLYSTGEAAYRGYPSLIGMITETGKTLLGCPSPDLGLSAGWQVSSGERATVAECFLSVIPW